MSREKTVTLEVIFQNSSFLIIYLRRKSTHVTKKYTNPPSATTSAPVTYYIRILLLLLLVLLLLITFLQFYHPQKLEKCNLLHSCDWKCKPDSSSLLAISVIFENISSYTTKRDLLRVTEKLSVL